MKKSEIVADPVKKVLELDFMKKKSVITQRIIDFVMDADIPMEANIYIEETQDYHYLDRKNRTYSLAERVGCRMHGHGAYIYVYVMAEWEGK